MKPLRCIIARLRGAWPGWRTDADLADELELHIDLQTEDNIRAGMTPEEARRTARLKFGAMESVKESYRDQRGAPFLESIVVDLRYAARQLWRTPAFTITAVVTIALGIGANTAIFSALNTVMWKPLPVPDPDRLVVLTRTSLSDEGETGESNSASPAEFAYWRTHSDALDDVAAFVRSDMNFTGGDVAELWHGRRVSAGLFSAMRIPVVIGRTFTPEEDRPDGPRVAVISSALWKRRFDGAPDALGKTVSLNGEPHTIIGVVADSPGVLELSAALTDVYVPFRLDPNSNDTGHIFTVVGRLKPGITLQQAREQLRLSADGFRSKFPKGLGPKDAFSARRYQDVLFDNPDDQSDTYVMMGAVGMVLLIACANVANLLLVRAANRRREIGIRIAIGAGRRRVIRQLLTECLLLSAAGGAIGVVAGDVAIRTLIAANFTDLPPFWKFELDWRVAGFALTVSLFASLAFGLMPALHGSRIDLNATLKDGGGRWGTGLRQNKMRAALVVSEISLAVILLVGSSLFIRSFIALHKVERGFDATNVLVMYTWMSSSKYAQTIRHGLERVRAIPGVIAAGSAGYVPLQGRLGGAFDIIGREPADGSSNGRMVWVPVSPGYFEAFKIPLKRGRVFTDRDDAQSAPVAVINESMARQFWKDIDPLQDRIVFAREDREQPWADPQVRQIVGIVGDVRQNGLNTMPEPQMYVPQAQLPDAQAAELLRVAPNSWVIRTETDTHEMSVNIQDEIRRATGLPVFESQSMNRILSNSIQSERFLTIVMTAFACMALLLAAVGVYGVMSYSVEQRTQEIGIRIALGAEASQVRNMIVRYGFTLTLAGIVLGLAAAWELAWLMQSLVFGVPPRDPLVFTLAPIVLAAVAMLAVWIPATRASRVTPMESLRCE
jgi:putative ABC transport system permease protein